MVMLLMSILTFVCTSWLLSIHILLTFYLPSFTGRLSALEALLKLVKVMPLSLLYDNYQVLFFPLTLQIVNDTVSECRQVHIPTLSHLHLLLLLLLLFVDDCTNILYTLHSPLQLPGRYPGAIHHL